MSSRLFQVIREDRGLCYDIGSQIKRYRDTGLFSVNAGVEHRHLAKSLRLILKELKRIRREPVSSKEFQQAREFFMSQLLFALEDTVDHMCWVGECEMLLGYVEPVERIVEQVERVHRSDLTDVSRKVLDPSRLNLAVIGPVKEAVSHRISQTLRSFS